MPRSRRVEWARGAKTRRQPMPFSKVNSRGSAGFNAMMQRHHLLPIQLLGERCFGNMFRWIGRANIGFDDFRSNGLLLPAQEEASIEFGLPLHRGPHKAYNQLVIERVGQIEKGWAGQRAKHSTTALVEAIFRLELLQQALRKRLLDERRRLVLNKHDPLGTGFDFQELDAMAEALWSATAQSSPS